MKTKLIALASLSALITKASDQRQHSEQNVKPRVEWSAYGLNNYWHERPQQDGEAITFVFPLAVRGNYVSMFIQSSTAESDLRGQSVWMVFDMAVTGGVPAFDYGWEGTSINNSQSPASFRFFVSDQATPYNLDTSTKHPEHYWFYDDAVKMVDVLDFIQPLSYEASFTDYGNWTDGEGHAAADLLYQASFLNCIAHARQKGVAFRGGRFFDVGVGTSSVFGQPSVTFRVLTFQTFIPETKR